MSKRKLLLADDSITIQKVVNLTFADEGIDVITVSNGNEAMAKIAEFKPDLVLADVNMPGLNGYQICEILKQNEQTSQIPVILLVGSFETFDEAEAGRVGANDVLTKPFQSIRQLVNKVTDLLNQKTVSTENEITKTEIDQTDNLLEVEEALQTRQEFLETLEREEPATKKVDFGDPGMDDEMIETNRVSDFSYSQSQITEISLENEEDNTSSPSFSSEESNDLSFEIDPEVFEETSEDQKEPISEENLQPSVPEAQIETGTIKEQRFEIEDIQSSSIATEITPETPGIVFSKTAEITDVETQTIASRNISETFTESHKIEDISQAKTKVSTFSEASVGFDESNLLELPPLVEETGIRPFTELFDTNAPTIQKREDARASQVASISPEIIESIVQKVAEKVSDRLKENLFSEIVPQITDEIIREISKEN